MENFDLRDIHLCIGTPCYGGQIYDKYMASYQRSEAVLREMGVKVSRLSLGSESLIPRGRNRLVHSYLALGAHFYLQIDADIEWEPQAIIGLLQSQKRVVACAYPIKANDFAAVAEAARKGAAEPQRFATRLAINPLLDDGGHQTFDHGCVRVRDAATGFLMVERNVFFEMMEHYPDLYYFSDIGPGTPEYGLPLFTLFDCQIVKEALWTDGPKIPRYLSEDYLFCRRWQDMGGDIWMYLGANLNHIGTNVFQGDVNTMFMPAVDTTKSAQVVG